MLINRILIKLVFFSLFILSCPILFKAGYNNIQLLIIFKNELSQFNFS